MLERYELLLKARGLKNADVVKGAKIPQTTLYEWKKGKYELKLDKIIAIAEFLNVTLDYFVLGKETDASEVSLLYNELNDEGQELLLERASELKRLGYIKSSKTGVVGA